MEDAEMELDDREPDDFEPEGRNVIKRVWTLEEDANPHPDQLHVLAVRVGVVHAWVGQIVTFFATAPPAAPWAP